MSSLKLKIIDFAKQELADKSVEVTSDLEIKSPKSIAYVVRWQLARKRSGSAKIKQMSEISGTTAKPYKQKGTGNARQGSKRSVQFVGGRTCHGPTPRSFDFSIPKKIAKLALADVLRSKLKEEKVIIFSGVDEKIKTSQINAALTKNDLKSVLVVYENDSKNSEFLVRSSRNLKNVKTLNGNALNVYDILSYDYLIVDNNVLENIKGALK